MKFSMIFEAQIADTSRDGEFRIMHECVEQAVLAEEMGFDRIWSVEHHCLKWYAHMSAPETFLAYVAGQTERIHLATGIRNLSPRGNHPIRVAEEVAMMDHLTRGRFELGTGRGAGWHEVAGFDVPDTKVTKDWWHEVIRELPRMWRETEYEYPDGEHFRVPGKRMILPKPWGNSHPPMWVARGSPQTWELAGQMGLGAIGFSIGSVDSMGPKAEMYKKAVADAPKSPNAPMQKYFIAQCYEKLGRTADARDFYGQVSKDHPQSTWAAKAQKDLARLPSL